MSVRFVLLLSLLVSATAPRLAAGQAAPPGAVPTPAPAAPPRVIAGEDGIAIESASGDTRLQIGVLAHVDGRFALDDSSDDFIDSFVVRRLRTSFRGRFARHFEFYVSPDFAGGTLTVQDAYLDTVFSPAFRVRLGKAKTPIGFERLQSASNMLFFERAFPTALVPNRDVGVQVLGNLSGGLVSYLAGVTNGAADGASADTDTNDGKDVSGRLIVRPFSRQPAGHVGRGLGLGISGSRGRAGALPNLRTQLLQQPFFSYAGGPTPAVADGIRTRYSPQIWYSRGPFSGWGEYVHTDTPIARGGAAADIAHDAWQVAASWVLTGENVADPAVGAGVRPRAPFNFGQGGRGAFQISARYHVLEVDDEAIALNLAAAGASRKAEAWTVGLRWYATVNLWYTVNFERTVFDDDPDGLRPPENALVFRSQFGF